MIGGTQFELFIATFVTFFVVIDAVGVAPIFASLTRPGGPKYARDMAIKSTIVATLILFFFAFAGPWLLGHMGISLDSFRAAGGVLLFLIALEMVFEKRQQRQKSRADQVLAEEEEAGRLDDISVFPLGIPMIAGPGSIATAMLYMQNAGGDFQAIGIVAGAIGVNLVLTALIFMAAAPLIKVMGESIAGAITRIFGVILAALAVQLMVDGIKGAFGLG
ncbi:MAG: MarC family protein [Alphaproteobacteria bacterium]|nr:MarC family protein [Alphaproteobacteria bacterium]